MTALEDLGALEATRVTCRSSFYRTEPQGYAEQPDFINAVCTLETRLSAAALIARMLEIEVASGRTREAVRNGPRPLDLDLLVFGAEVIDENGLKVPHPRIAERRFVLEPLAEIAPELHIPGQGAVKRLLQDCPPQRVEKVVAPGQ